MRSCINERKKHLLKNSIDNYRTFLAIYDEITEDPKLKKHEEIYDLLKTELSHVKTILVSSDNHKIKCMNKMHVFSLEHSYFMVR
ncbi:hypothetical protein DH09_00925 (plasmid) [Bacillaceae bacterium JMAK1]|nr:hypothetical protein DH09_00925 [Bacillaceae bacterium JMAK1]